MCNTNTKKSNNIKKKKKQPARRSRTKTRKPKYLSLSKHIKTSQTATITKMTRSNHHNHQLTLFPLHPENLVDDRSFGDENVADLLFDSESVPGDASLTGLLTTTTTATTVSEEEQDESMSYGRVFDENDNESLVKTAMKRRNSERDATEEEKWVCYSEVVEEATSASSSKGINVISRGSSSSNAAKRKKKKRKLAETTSSLVSQEGNSTTTNGSNSLSSLALKLDYQEILKAWSDKGSLYIQGGDLSPQTVPDIYYDHHPGLMDGWGPRAGNLWKVPESGGLKIKEEIEDSKDGLKLGQREASVLRYKEKRQNRLFAKRIRYEVRKLNAEKRPRMKGRFVKII